MVRNQEGEFIHRYTSPCEYFIWNLGEVAWARVHYMKYYVDPKVIYYGVVGETLDRFNKNQMMDISQEF